MRDFPINRWNWSDELGKWVYVEEDDDGNKKYTYQIKPPKEFLILTEKLEEMNKKLMKAKEAEEKIAIFENLMEISKKMNNMRKQDKSPS